jgi:pimeloyl-ACP methyl ester carboxylesterase
VKALLFPGLDGTGELFAPLAIALAGTSLTPEVVAYPRDRAMGYDALFDEIVAPRLAERAVVIAESFSGPLAIRLASRVPERVVALVLVATFARAPRRVLLRAAAALGGLPGLFARASPDWALKRFLIGADAPDAAVSALAGAIAGVQANVLAARIRAVAAVDERAAYAALTVPTLYLAADEDRLVPPSSGLELVALRPSTKRVVIAAPHLLLQRAPAVAGRAIGSLVAEATRETS